MRNAFIRELIKQALLPAIRQYKHNDGTEGIVAGLDCEETITIVTEILIKLSERNAERSHEN